MMNIKTIAKKIGRPLGTVRHWATHGKIPARKVGDQWFAELKTTEAYALKRPRHGVRKAAAGVRYRSPLVAPPKPAALPEPRPTSSEAILKAIRGLPVAAVFDLPLPASLIVDWINDGCPTR